MNALLPGTASASPDIQRGMHGKAVPVEIRAVDDLDLPPPDFVKIDVEGMERTLRRHRPDLYIELHGSTAAHKRGNARAVIAFLQDRGYRMRWLESAGDRVGDWERPSSHLIATPAAVGVVSRG